MCARTAGEAGAAASEGLLPPPRPRAQVPDWRAATNVEGFEPSAAAQLPGWLWQAVEAMDESQRRRLLRFWTGLSHLPAGGFARLVSGAPAAGRRLRFLPPPTPAPSCRAVPPPPSATATQPTPHQLPVLGPPPAPAGRPPAADVRQRGHRRRPAAAQGPHLLQAAGAAAGLQVVRAAAAGAAAGPGACGPLCRGVRGGASGACLRRCMGVSSGLCCRR
jgi:hypothetical protein